MDALFEGAETAITTTLIPAVVSIILVGSLFWLGVRWYKKGKNAGNS